MPFNKQETQEIILTIKTSMQIKTNFKKNAKDGDKILNLILVKMVNYFCGIRPKTKEN